MSLVLYAHPFSSYCQKVLIALYENQTPFDLEILSPENPGALAALEALWPFKRFPAIVDDGQAVVETSIIIEHLAVRHPGPVPLIPRDAREAIEVRMMDRFFDLYVMTPMQKIVFDCLRPAESRDAHGVREARALLETSYAWLDQKLAGREWATEWGFSLADCAAAPSLFYADWVQPMSEAHTNLRGYRKRLLARPSFARAVNEARPYRHFFPPGAPDRD